MYLVIKMVTTTTESIFHARSKENDHRAICCPHSGSEESIIRRNIAMISWTISIQIEILPYNSSRDHLSLSNLTIIIVLLKARAVAIYRLVTRSNQRKSAMSKPIPVVKTTCQIHITRDAFHKSLTTLVSNHNHTMKRSKATHKWENTSTCAVCCNKENQVGQISIHAMRYPMRSGCFKAFIT